MYSLMTSMHVRPAHSVTASAGQKG